MMNRWIFLPATFLLGIVVGTVLPSSHAQTAEDTSGQHTAWYFYRVKWGHQDEFLELYRRNHYPVMKAQFGDRIRDFNAYVPQYHGDGRADWTFASVITFRDTEAFAGPNDESAIARRLFPDFETFQKEERRRFEILDAHWDVPLTEVKME